MILQSLSDRQALSNKDFQAMLDQEEAEHAASYAAWKREHGIEDAPLDRSAFNALFDPNYSYDFSDYSEDRTF